MNHRRERKYKINKIIIKNGEKAKKYIYSNDTNDSFSFTNLCILFNLNSQWLRKYIEKFIEKISNDNSRIYRLRIDYLEERVSLTLEQRLLFFKLQHSIEDYVLYKFSLKRKNRLNKGHV